MRCKLLYGLKTYWLFRFLFQICAMLVLVSMYTSCKTTRAVYKEPIKEEGDEFLFEQLKKNELKFEWFSAKFDADYIIDKKVTSFSGQIRICRDSIIWISISPALGIEMARMLITTDTVKFLNRIDKSYFVSDFNYINSFINNVIDFDILQAFLIGNDFSFYENTKFKASIDNMEYRLLTAERNKLKKYVKENELVNQIPIQNIWLDPQTFKITKVMIKEIYQEGRKFEAKYSNYQKMENQLFPLDVEFDISSENNIIVLVKYSKVKVNEELEFPFGIPGNYKMMQ